MHWKNKSDSKCTYSYFIIYMKFINKQYNPMQYKPEKGSGTDLMVPTERDWELFGMKIRGNFLGDGIVLYSILNGVGQVYTNPNPSN